MNRFNGFILNLDENAKQFEFRVSYAVLYKLDIFAKWNSIGIIYQGKFEEKQPFSLIY